MTDAGLRNPVYFSPMSLPTPLTPATAFPADVNYDEALVPAYVLPDALVGADGRPITTAAAWRERRRPEVVALFEQYVFGTSPGRPAGMAVTLRSEGDALGGSAVRREVAVTFGEGVAALNLLVFLPKDATGPVPAILGPNFLGNHTVHADPGITLPDFSFSPDSDVRIAEGRPTEASRGMAADRWAVERILARGYALATFYAGDLYPDHRGGRAESIQPFIAPAGRGPTWGALATWAWGMSRALDALAAMPEIDAGGVVLFGHSRHGKAALWAGALDERFAIVISNNSGSGGAALMRRKYGERLHHLTSRYPHWFAPAYAGYAGREEDLPVDQHMLLALIAPRPLYVASAIDDRWADPKGEFMAAAAADPVYRLLGTDGLPAGEQPPVGVPVAGRIGYHVRAGGHGVTAWDWERYLDFADRQFAH